MDLRYLFLEIKCFFSKDRNETINTFYRKQGMQIGKGTHVFSNLQSMEPYLINIGEHVTISTDVKLITHDASIGTVGERTKGSDLVGKISIGDYSFIGCGSIIMYGVDIGNKCIIGAGSVVTKTVPDGEVWAGNPAKKICNTEQFVKDNLEYMLDLHGLGLEERKKQILNSLCLKKR